MGTAAGAAMIAAAIGCSAPATQFHGQTAMNVVATPPPPPPPPIEQPSPPPPVVIPAFAIAEQIQFALNSARLLPASNGVLDELTKALIEHAEAKKVEVQGHTSSDGGEVWNRQLSQARANAVVAYLTGHGVPTERLVAKGYGSSAPVAENNTEAGREKNRRVQFVILEQ